METFALLDYFYGKKLVKIEHIKKSNSINYTVVKDLYVRGHVVSSFMLESHIMLITTKYRTVVIDENYDILHITTH